MPNPSNQRPPNFEDRLDQLREEARQHGTVGGDGVTAVGGPLPARTAETLSSSSYYGLPIIKPPVWEWMIAAYFFIGGLAGMAGLLAVAALFKHDLGLARAAMWPAGIGAILSPILLTWDLGRPSRFVYMLRVFKYQSPMSVGSWIVSGFGLFAVPGLILTEIYWRMVAGGTHLPVLHVLSAICIIGSGGLGIFLATYTGALIAVTAVPAWNLHRVVLPFHFGMAGLGSAVALIRLLGFRGPALTAIFLFAAGAETLVLFWLEIRKHGAVDHALHHGLSGWTLRIGEVLAGPLALALALANQTKPAAGSLLLGALLTRFGWLSAGRASACSAESVIESQRGAHPTASSRKPFLLSPQTKRI